MMDDLARTAALHEIEKLRTELIGKVNANLDALIQRLMDGGVEEKPGQEYLHRLGAALSLLKGTKPTAVIFDGQRVDTATWRNVYSEILRHFNTNDKTHAALMSLRNKVGGRKRIVLSDSPASMCKPVLISEELYAESYFDTEWLLRMLVHIIDAAHCDYSGITIAVRGK